MKFVIPFAGKPKARPRLNANGPTFMPKDYMEWKDRVIEWARFSRLHKQRIEGTVHIYAVFDTDKILVEVTPCGHKRPKGVGGDLDNLVGGLLDALQGAGVIDNDRNVMEIVASFADPE